jgi:hypothetical protein
VLLPDLPDPIENRLQWMHPPHRCVRGSRVITDMLTDTAVTADAPLGAARGPRGMGRVDRDGKRGPMEIEARSFQTQINLSQSVV